MANAFLDFLSSSGWDESKHKRDAKGRFTGGGASGVKSPSPTPKHATGKDTSGVMSSIKQALKLAGATLGGGKDPPPIPKELYSATTVVEGHAPITPVIEKLGIHQGDPASIGHALEAVNPNFKLNNPKDDSYKLNCQNCTVAYELQRRGYNVTAMPHSGKAINGEIANAFRVFDLKDTDFKQPRGKTNLELELKKNAYPVGSRFIILQKLRTKKEKWHNYIVEKTGEKEVKYFDPQNGNADVSDLPSRTSIEKGNYRIYFARVDDKEMRVTDYYTKKKIDYTKVIKAVDKK